MGICAEELRTFVIRPTLEYLGEWSAAGENLLLGTAAQESGLGFHLTNLEDQGMGIFQIRPNTHKRIWDKFLVHQPSLASNIRGLASQHEFLCHPHAELATNLSYATAIAWMIYRRHNKELPNAEDIEGLGRYWQRHYQRHCNSRRRDFVLSFEEYVQPKASAA